MRKTNLTFLTCLAVITAALCSPSAFAQLTTTSIFDYNKSWQYFQQGIQPTNQGTLTWTTNTYNDSAWTPGNGVLAFESDPGNYPPINTTLNRTVPNGASNNITYYFRTHFNFTANRTNAILFFTNVVDDGLILYLNGVRLYDIRVPTTTPLWGTLAGGTPAEGARELIAITNTALLRQGDNVLAVELHDTAVDSSDVAFGLALAWRYPQTFMVSQPTNITAEVGDVVDLPVTVTGDSLRYWWFRNGVPLHGPTNSSTLRFNSIRLTNAGTYHLVASNVTSGARSSNFVVNVFADTAPLEYVNAVINEGEPPNRVYAIFDEDPLRVNSREPFRNATNTNNYRLREVASPGREIDVISALPGPGSRSVRLTLATNIDCSKEYVLFVSNLSDSSTNIMVPDVGAAQIVGCQYRSNLVNYQSVWSWYFSYEAERVATNWMATNFVVPGEWGIGESPFYFTSTVMTNCFGAVGSGQPVGTPISIGYPTYVFRHEFVIPTNFPNVGLLRMTHVVDDACIIYLNGRELLRDGPIPLTPINHDFLATNCIESACRAETYTLSNVQPGTNVLAMEVHNCDEFTGADILMGIEVDIITTNFPTRIPDMNIRQIRTATARTNIVTWQPRGWRLQTTTNLANTSSWVNVAGLTTNSTGYTNSSATIGTERQRYYRLKRPDTP